MGIFKCASFTEAHWCFMWDQGKAFGILHTLYFAMAQNMLFKYTLGMIAQNYNLLK